MNMTKDIKKCTDRINEEMKSFRRETINIPRKQYKVLEVKNTIYEIKNPLGYLTKTLNTEE